MHVFFNLDVIKMMHYKMLVNVFSVCATIFLASQVYSQTCGRSRDPPQNNISDKFHATEGEFPWMASVGMMEKSNTFRHICSGFLIDRRHVVSSAHCFDTVEPTPYFARIGSVKWKEGDEYSVSKIAVPESYRPDYPYYAIAILTLSREVDIPDFVPICLPDDKITGKDFCGMGLTLLGWGISRFQIFSPDLYVLRDMIVLNNEACTEIYQDIISSSRKEFYQGISTALMCARDYEKAGISLITGGPLIFEDRNRWFAVGILSFGINSGLPGLPYIFTKLSSHLEWIRKNTKD